MYTDMWEIVDDNGTIHSGSKQEMLIAWDVMTGKTEDGEITNMRTYLTDWTGDLRLIQVRDIYN